MQERVVKLREQSLNTGPELSIERARLVTETYQEYEGKVSTPVLRALAFKNVMENKKICINKGELIVGERGEKPQSTPTYPELCCHTMEDMKTINDRDKVSFQVDDEVRSLQQEEIIPFWEERSIRNKIFKKMDEEWMECYQAGIFTEFMEQRAPGHTVLDNKIYHYGFNYFKRKIENSISNLDFYNDPEAYDKREELKAMLICADALIAYGKRHAELAEKMANKETNIERKKELKEIASVCAHVPANKPRNFMEALQMYWFVHLGVITELNTWDSFNPGRLDQHLYPFYRKGLEEGKLDKEKARELLQCFWIKFNNQPAPPKVGITLKESGTYTDFANINNGGLKKDGSDGVNELTYLILDVIDEMKLLQPSTNIQLSKKNPDRFLKRALKIIRKGWGQPSIFNADAVIEEMLRQGKSLEDARDGGTSGCVETGAFGKESYILTGYFNLPKILEITLNNGIDPRNGKKIGINTGNAVCFSNFNELMSAFEKQLHHFINIKIKGNNVIEKIYAEMMPAPFLSTIISDCIDKGKDYNNGGARYNTRYIQGVGIGTITDSLTSIKYNIYDYNDQNVLSMKKLMEALKENYQDYEELRDMFINNTPKYGNDNDYADEIMVKVFEMFYQLVNGRPTTTGGKYRINMLPTTCHVYFGSVLGATPDGRKAAKPVSEGISPVQGADRNGPTAVIKSTAKMDHLKTGGTLLNQKFTPQLMAGATGISNAVHLVRSYFKLDGHHIQFNVIDADTLRQAQKEPEKYRNLIVRVAGYSDYFNNLSEELQNEIITRTEHDSF